MVDWTARLLWQVARGLPAAAAPVRSGWLSGVPTARGRVGVHWLPEYAARTGCELVPCAHGGLIPDLAQWPVADQLTPELIGFYTETTRFPMRAEGGWRWPVAPLTGPLNAWVGRRWGQLQLPRDTTRPVDSRLWTVGGRTWWTRVYQDVPDEAFFVAEYLPFRGDAMVRMSFPVPGGALVACFEVHGDDGALTLGMRGARNGSYGMYLVPADGTPRFVPLQRERLRVRVDGGEMHAEHTFALAGWVYLRLVHRAVRAPDTPQERKQSNAKTR